MPYQHIRSDIEGYNPGVTLLETPRWLLPIDRIHTKTQENIKKTKSSMVITVLGTPPVMELHELVVSGSKNTRISLYRVSLQVQPYIDCNAATHCTNCQQFGHHIIICRNQAKCRHCKGPHFSVKHTYYKTGCSVKGNGCAHFPTKCINCNATGHWAGDQSCPNMIEASEIVQCNKLSQLEKQIRLFNPTPSPVATSEIPVVLVENDSIMSNQILHVHDINV